MKIVKKNKNKALVLFMCIWLLIMLIIAAMRMVYSGSINSSAAIANQGRARAMWAARAGVDYSISILLQDAGVIDSTGDSWFNSPKLFKDVKIGENASFTVYKNTNNELQYGISDEASKINILALPGEVFNSSAFYQQNKMAYTDTISESYSSSEIQKLRLAGLRENTKELGLSIVQAYGEDTNLNGKLDWNENDGQLSFPPDNSDGKLTLGVLHNATVYSFDRNIDSQGTPRVNINIASQSELLSLPGVTLPNVLWILENRPFESVTELFLPDITPEIFLVPLSTEKELKAVAQQAMQATSQGEEEILPKPLHPQVVRSIYDRLTVSDKEINYGLINVNTASVKILTCLAGIEQVIAEKIAARRDLLPEGYSSPAEIFGCGAIGYDLYLKVAQCFTVRSNVFTIHSVGKCDLTGRTCTIEAVVERKPIESGLSEENPEFKILYWKQD